MDEKKLKELAVLAGAAEMVPNEAVRMRAQSLMLTLSHIRQVRGLLITMEADAVAQENGLQVALVKPQTV